MIALSYHFLRNNLIFCYLIQGLYKVSEVALFVAKNGLIYFTIYNPCKAYKGFNLERVFFEYENNLYIERGGRGYGAVTVDFDSVELVEVNNGVVLVEIDPFCLRTSAERQS